MEEQVAWRPSCPTGLSSCGSGGDSYGEGGKVAQNGLACVLNSSLESSQAVVSHPGRVVGTGWEALLKAPFLQAVESGALELSPAFHQKNWQHWFSHIG